MKIFTTYKEAVAHVGACNWVEEFEFAPTNEAETQGRVFHSRFRMADQSSSGLQHWVERGSK